MGHYPHEPSPKPRLALRVGVTGHRELADADSASLGQLVSQVLEQLENGVGLALSENGAELLYNSEEPPLLQLISPLAEGADRLVARAAVERGWPLIAPLPFPQNEYENDFLNSVGEFQELLDYARQDERGSQVVELDGDRGNEKLAYLRVGRFVLRHSDLLIAIWDGEDEKDIGGTGQIVREARRYGIPIVWIDSKPDHALCLLLDGHDEREKAYTPENLRDALMRLLSPRHLLDNSEFGRRNRRGLRDYVERIPVHYDPTMEPDFLYKGPYAPKGDPVGRLIKGVFDTFIAMLAPKRVVQRNVSPVDVKKSEPPAGQDNSTVRHYYLAYQRADALSVYFAKVHRSAYVLVYFFGVLALSCALAAIYFSGEPVPLIRMDAKTLFTSIELALLAGVLFLILCDRRGAWQSRWLDYRLLAELLRENDIMAQVGRTFPHRRLADLDDDLPERAWVLRYYLAIVRSAGVVGATYHPDYLMACGAYMRHTRIPDQLWYHVRNVARIERVNSWLIRISEVFFGLTVVCVMAKLFSWSADEFMAGLWAGIFPAIAYGSFLIRNQAEFEIVVRRSQRVVTRLKRRRDAFAKLEKSPLNSEDLAHEVLGTAFVMLDDTVDWAGIFEVKHTEA